MKIAFLDPMRWDYSVETPYEHPLGGSQSSLCYLATELAARGHQVSLVNHISAPAKHRGVNCVGWTVGANAKYLNEVDVVVVLNASIGSALRRLGVRSPLVLWTGHAHDQRDIGGLQRSIERDAWSGFAFVSKWQAENYLRHFHIDPSRSRVLHYAISPVFAQVVPSRPWFVTRASPVLVYTSAPFRGLDVLLSAFPLIRARSPDIRLRVFSSMAVYRKPDDDRYQALYAWCANTEGVEYVGSLGQARLAKEMSGAAALAYPSTFPETFCIAAAEALALGAMLLTTRLGALPELFGESARMVSPNWDRRQLARDFAAETCDWLDDVLRNPATSAVRRSSLINDVRARFSWVERARDWEAWLATLQQRGAAAESSQTPTGDPPPGAETTAVQTDLGELLQAGVAHHRAGRLAEAEVNYRRVLAAVPDHAEALHLLGVIACQLGHHETSLELIGRAIQQSGNSFSYYNSYGVALHKLNRLDEAVASYDRALALKADYAEALNNRGNTLHQLEHFAEAVENYDRVLAIQPDHAAALNNRGNALRALGRFAEALESYDRALVLRPDNPEALNSRGITLQTLGRFAEALDSYDRALAIRPDHAEALSSRGIALHQLGRITEALESHDQALAVRPDLAGAHYNRGITLRFQGTLDEAIASFGRAAALHPGCAMADWVNGRQSICDWSNFREDEARARNAIKAEVSVSSPFILLALSSTPEEQLDCGRQVIAGMGASAILPGPQPPQLRRSERIRLGYLSADFHEHATAYLIAGLIERHDRGRFAVIGYSYGPDDGSTMRARLTGAFDRFVNLGSMPHRQAAELIHDDTVDILIDLKGFTRNARTEILAHRPAPIQVNYLGYPGTLGADFVDYIIVDPFVVPIDQQRFFSERLVHLPDCYQCNDDQRAIAEHTPSRAECGLPPEGFVFCCFNASYKLSPAFFDIWMRLLRAVPASVLWLLHANPWAKANLAREAAARGVAPERLVFAPKQAVPEHLARHRLADLFLDTLPYNAHTTASDALWAGVPVLTCAGNTFAGRVAGSLSHGVGLPELVTTSLEEYEAVALRLAQQPETLARLRARLAQNRATHPLFDTARFTGHLEMAYQRMWETWRDGRAPAAFSVTPLSDSPGKSF